MTKQQTHTLYTTKAEVSLIDPNTIRMRVNENADICERDILDMNAAKRQLIGDKKHFVIFVAPQVGKFSKEARKISASEIINENAIAKGIVAKNLSMTMIGNFFINFNRPPSPTRVFKTEEEAMRWLKDVGKIELTEV